MQLSSKIKPVSIYDVSALNHELIEHNVEVGIPQEGYQMFQVDPSAIDIMLYVGAGFFASGVGIDVFRETAKLILKTIWDRVTKTKNGPTPMSVTFEGKSGPITITNVPKEQQDKVIDALVCYITNEKRDTSN